MHVPKFRLAPFLLLALFFNGCNGSNASYEELSAHATVEEAADHVIQALDARDWERLSCLVEPNLGVLFSPYAYVNPDEHLAFSADEIRSFSSDTSTYTWGRFDGKGNLIEKTVEDYFQRFIYPVDFAASEPGEPGEQIGSGNSINNIHEMLRPLGNVTFVEYHHPGTQEYDGMDWRSLRLVFLEDYATWRLIAIVHDQWTI